MASPKAAHRRTDFSNRFKTDNLCDVKRNPSAKYGTKAADGQFPPYHFTLLFLSMIG